MDDILDDMEWEDDEVPKPGQTPQNPTKSHPKQPEEWISAAWHDYLGGHRNYTQLGAKYGVSNKVMKNRLAKHSQALKLVYESGTMSALADYISGCERDLADIDAELEISVSPNARVGLLRLRGDIRQRVATTLGVITARTRTELTGADGAPISVASVSRDELLKRLEGMASKLSEGENDATTKVATPPPTDHTGFAASHTDPAS
jgi:hypothetical protein